MEKHRAIKNNVNKNSVNDNNNLNEEKKETEQATKKTIKVASDVALEAFTGGAYSKVKRVPIVGNAIDKSLTKISDKSSKIINNTPIVGNTIGKASKVLDNSGINDTVNTLINNKNDTSLETDETTFESEEKTNKENKKDEKSDYTSKILDFKFINIKIILISIFVTFLFLIIFIFMVVSGKDFAMHEATGSSIYSSTISNNTTGEIVNFSNIVLNGKNAAILKTGETLVNRLGQNKITEWSNLIENNAKLAGYGTGKAPAQAAYDLINEALKENIIIPYLWGGGHSNIYKGVNPEWGAYVRVTADNLAAQPKGSLQPNGLDCSGFVSWALKNGGCTNFVSRTAKEFKNIGKTVAAKEAVTGDIAASNGHVMIILSNTSSSLIVAEAKGASKGIIFSEYNYEHFNKYNIVSMHEYYAANCKG